MKKLAKFIPLDVKVVCKNIVRYGKLTPDEINKVTLTFSLFKVCNCLFIHVPKTAGMSIYKALFDSEPFGHRSLQNYYSVYGKYRVNKRFKFCFVRNPYTRIKSAYLYVKRGGRQRPFDLDYQKRLGKVQSFEDFVLNWLPKPEIFEMEHFRTQTSYVIDFNNKIRMDFIGKYENLNQDFNILTSKLNIQNVELPNLNKSNNKDDESLAMNDEIKAAIYNLYRVDFDNFGYEK